MRRDFSLRHSAHAPAWSRICQELRKILLAPLTLRSRMTPRSSSEAVAHNKSGFTLIELSIVLVIIGLIVGGVLVGQDLIRAAGVRAQVAQIDQTKAAINTFKLKYNCIAGDCPNAGQFGFTYDVGTGNPYAGDEQIWCDDQYSLNYGLSKEILNFWSHLSQAKLVAGDFLGWDASLNVATPVASLEGYAPHAKIGGGLGVVTACTMKRAADANTILLGNALAIYKYEVISGASRVLPAMTAGEAFDFDSKIDDGLPATGVVINLTFSAGSMPLGYPYSIGCTGGNGNVTANMYDVAGALNSVWTAPYGYWNQSPEPNMTECAIAVGKAW